MSLGNNKSNYSKLAKYFHWSFVIIFIFGVAKQVENLNQLEDISFLRFEIIFAIFFLCLSCNSFRLYEQNSKYIFAL